MASARCTLPWTCPLKDAHARLDAAVLAAYGFNSKADLLEQLLTLNQLVAKHVAEGEAVVAPGIPANHPDPAKLASADGLGRA